MSLVSAGRRLQLPRPATGEDNMRSSSPLQLNRRAAEGANGPANLATWGRSQPRGMTGRILWLGLWALLGTLYGTATPNTTRSTRVVRDGGVAALQDRAVYDNAASTVHANTPARCEELQPPRLLSPRPSSFSLQASWLPPPRPRSQGAFNGPDDPCDTRGSYCAVL